MLPKAARKNTNRQLLMFQVAYLLCMLLGGLPAFTQNKISKHSPGRITSVNDTLLPTLINKIADYSFTIDRNDFLLRRKYNLAPIEVDLPGIEKRIKGFKTRLETKGGQMNLLSLNSSIILLAEAAEQLSGFQKSLSAYHSQIKKSNEAVTKIVNDPDLHAKVPDSILLEQLHDIRSTGQSLDSLQHVTIARLNLMRNRVSLNLLQARDIISDMRYLVMSIKMTILVPEDVPLHKARTEDYNSTYYEITSKALQLSGKIILIYINRKRDVIAISLLLFLITTVWCMSNNRQIKLHQQASVIFNEVHFLRRRVFVASLMALFTYSPLFFADPTISYLHANGLLLLLTLSILIMPFLTGPSKMIWLMVCILWVYYALDDLLLETSFAERWGLFISGLFMIGICIFLVRMKTRIFKTISHSPATSFILFFTLALSAMSVLFNITGNVTLAKMAGKTAIEGLILALSLKVFCTMVLEAIYLQSEAYYESRFSEFINYKELEQRYLRILWTLALMVWLAALLRHITLYDAVLAWFLAFLTKQRAIGNMTFTFGSAVVFFGIIWISSVVSRFINFFFNYAKAGVIGKRSTMGSMRLLMRLAIWAIGFLIAVAATGIPLDKLSLLIGALGVGIGFGLQNIVNNLVSGVILAFERPVQIGDLIEIGNKKGIVEEIGVRASKIKSSDGADIIIPNGDLLGQHLIKWTMKDRHKRVEFIIGIRYQSDIHRARELILETLKENENILIPPEPVVIVQEFTDNAINIRILFWSSEVSQAGTLRSNAMIAIFEAFTVSGIQLPYSRQEIVMN